MPLDPKEIESYIVPNGGNEFVGDDFRLLCFPSVYLFMKDGLPLYIGMSNQGISRPAQSNHRQADKARLECDKVLIYACRSRRHAVRLEELLIFHLSPKYNKSAKTGYLAKRIGVNTNVTNALRENMQSA